MCGIAGFVARSNSTLAVKTLYDMTFTVNHRGPDDEGYIFLTQDRRLIRAGGISTPTSVWQEKTDYFPEQNILECREINATIGFGHRRLSIIDLTATGHQPMSFENSRYWITYNGEIYNYREIRIELEGEGYSFRTTSDTEVILASYAKWGELCLNRFVGMWALAIFDSETNEIFLARDRYGIKPLYYHFGEAGDFFFASEIKQFTVINGWKARMNPQRVYDQLVYSFTDHTDETMFSGVHNLPPGSYFKSSINAIQPDVDNKINYSKWYVLNRTVYTGSYGEAINEFKALFERSVIGHLYADVPVGTALSGGLDSSSIVCEINRQFRSIGTTTLQKTFSSCSTEEKYSERKWMDIVIEHTGVRAFFIYPNLQDAINLTPDIIWHHDEPYQSQSAFLAYSLFKLARENDVKVLLNGQGADEYLGGYGQFTYARYASLAKRLKFLSIFYDIKDFRKLSHISLTNILVGMATHLIPSSLRKGLVNLRISDDNIKRIIDCEKLGARQVNPFDNIPVGYKTVPEISQHLTFFSTLPKYLHWEDRNSMAHSVEARVPFLDHRLVEFSYNLPDHFIEKNGITKRILREAMKGDMPEEIINRRDKMGFITPEEHWVKMENPKLFKLKLTEAIDVSDGILKPYALNYFEKILSGRIPFDYTYWRIILFGEWIKKFTLKI